MNIKSPMRLVVIFCLVLLIINIGTISNSIIQKSSINQGTAASELIRVEIDLYRIYYRKDKDAFSRGDMYVKWEIFATDNLHEAQGRIPTSGTVQVHRRTSYKWDTQCISWELSRNIPITYTFRAWDDDPKKDDAFPRVTFTIKPWIYTPGLYQIKSDRGDCVYYVVFYYEILT